MTVSEAWSLAVSELCAAGFERAEAALVARLLIDRCTGNEYSHLKEPGAALEQDGQASAFRADLRKIAGGYPLAYLLGEREFYGLRYKCDERALIPRADTEILVEAALMRLRQTDAARVADLGTGTGCIAISIAHTLPHSVVHATDASETALSLARENASRLLPPGRIDFFAGLPGEWAAPLAHQRGVDGYHAVLTNPPYISPLDIAALQPQIRDHEPRMALDGGEDAVDCYRQIAAQCGDLLAPGGFLMAELGAGQFSAVSELFRSRGWFVEAPVLDLAGIERVLVATRG